MTPTIARKKQRHIEDQMQAAVVQHLELRGDPDMLYWHTPNGSKLGGARTKSGIPLAAIRGKRLGLRAGVSDLVLFRAGRLHALELKAPGGKPTIEQHAFLDGVQVNGGLADWTDDLDTALHILTMWGLLRASKRAGPAFDVTAPTA